MKFKEDGSIQLTTGEVVKNGDVSNLSKEGIIELYDTPATMFEIMFVKTGQQEIKNDIKHLIDKVDNIKSTTQAHLTTCPINPAAVEKIVEDKVGQVVKNKVLSTATIFKALIVIVGFFSLLGGAVYAIVEAVKQLVN